MSDETSAQTALDLPEVSPTPEAPEQATPTGREPQASGAAHATPGTAPRKKRRRGKRGGRNRNRKPPAATDAVAGDDEAGELDEFEQLAEGPDSWNDAA